MNKKSPQIVVERIAVKDMVNFAQKAQNDPKKYQILPITVLRATAHSQNPAASPDDIALLVAYANNKCIGYLGILPCFYRCKNKITKVYALSTFLIDKSYRGRSAVKTLMSHAIALKYDFLFTDYTPSSEKFIKRNPQWFKFAGYLPYLYIHLLPHTSLLWWIKNRFKPTQYFINPIFSTNQQINKRGGWYFFYKLISPRISRRWKDIKVRSVSKVQELEHASNESRSPIHASFFRGVDIVNWMIQYPWITEDSSLSLNYFFSYKRELHRFLAFELNEKKTGKHRGYFVFLVTKKRDLTVLKILDYSLCYNSDLHCIFNIAFREAARWKAELMVAPQDFWPIIKTHPLLHFLTQRKKRGYYIHSTPQESAFPDNLKNLDFNLCDSDYAFS
jgi:hypothetical protein